MNKHASDSLASLPQSSPEPLLLTQKQAAKLLGVDRTTVWRLVCLGIIRPVEICPGTFRYRRSDVEALAQDGYRALLGSRKKVAA